MKQDQVYALCDLHNGESDNSITGFWLIAGIKPVTSRDVYNIDGMFTFACTVCHAWSYSNGR